MIFLIIFHSINQISYQISDFWSIQGIKKDILDYLKSWIDRDAFRNYLQNCICVSNCEAISCLHKMFQLKNISFFHAEQYLSEGKRTVDDWALCIKLNWKYLNQVEWIRRLFTYISIWIVQLHPLLLRWFRCWRDVKMMDE